MESIRPTMSGCMAKDKPKIAILMAVYEPRLDWLREQLLSLNSQTYSNLILYIRDDCSPTVPLKKIQTLVKKCITKFPFNISRNEKNLGSNLTFQNLTEEANGDLFAYCDQDDIWLPHKLTTLENELEKAQAIMSCSDMFVIDGNGKIIADSISKIRRHHIFRSGNHLASSLLISNFVTGCTMLVSAKIAKQAIPFCPFMVHDHYLALFCAIKGNIQSVMQPLIYYRIHGGNQTGIMVGVIDKKTYQIKRIQLLFERLKWLKIHLDCDNELQKNIEDAIFWTNARLFYWNTGRGILQMWKYRKFGKSVTLFEILFSRLPEKLFLFAITLLRNSHL